jgi:hypothetical protein
MGWLLPGGFSLRHQIAGLWRQLGTTRPRFCPGDRVFLAALLHRLPREVLARFRLLVRPDTVLRWHRDLLARRNAARSVPRRPGRPRTVRSIRLLVLRLGRDRPGARARFDYLGRLPPLPGWGLAGLRLLRDRDADRRPVLCQNLRTAWPAALRSALVLIRLVYLFVVRVQGLIHQVSRSARVLA